MANDFKVFIQISFIFPNEACNGATHQELILEDAGADATDTALEVETTYSGSTELEKDIDCCSKCNLKDECDFWVRATDSNGCWLKLANGKRIKHVSSSNRRGGMRKTSKPYVSIKREYLIAIKIFLVTIR